MELKKFWKETIGGFVLKNVIIATVILVAICWLALIGIDYYTHHGESEVIPDLRGLYVEEATQILAKKGLYTQVIDSVYVRDKRIGTIIDQIPAANSSVKSNRPVYLIINSRKAKQITLPEVLEVSYRQADAMLKSVGLSVANVEYAPSQFKDLVIEVKFHERVVIPGSRIPEGSAVVLVVGSGSTDTESIIPPIKGIGLDEATEKITSASLEIGAVEFDVPPSGNESSYFIYRQRPAAGTSVPAGTKINVYLTSDKSRLSETFEEDKKPDTNEEFF